MFPAHGSIVMAKCHVSIAVALALSCAVASVLPESSEGVRAQGLGDELHRRAVRELATGKLLVSARNLMDPNFARTVVLLADFNKDGAIGLIVNRPAKVALSRLFPGLAQSPAGAATAFQGGPVLAPGVVALLRSGTAGSGSRRIVKDVQLVTSRESIEEILAAGRGANLFRVYVGYAGWAAGQLEAETAQGAWHVIDGDADIVFDPNSDATWQHQIERTESLSARQDRASSGLLESGPGD